jgi:hypothetical protein
MITGSYQKKEKEKEKGRNHETISFRIATKKYLGKNLTKEVKDLYTKCSKTFYRMV